MHQPCTPSYEVIYIYFAHVPTSLLFERIVCISDLLQSGCRLFYVGGSEILYVFCVQRFMLIIILCLDIV